MRFKRVIYMTSMSDPMKRVVNTRIENNTLFSNKILSSLQLLGVQTTPFYLQAPCSWFLGVKPKQNIDSARTRRRDHYLLREESICLVQVTLAHSLGTTSRPIRMHCCSEIEILMDKKRNRSTSIVHFYYLSKYKTHRQVECLTNHKNATYFICRSNSMFKGTKCNKTAI